MTSGYKTYRYTTILLLLLSFFFANANSDSLSVKYDTRSDIRVLKLDKEHIDKYKNDKDFDYTEYKYENKYLKKIKRWLYNILLKIFNWIFGHKKGVKYLAKFIKYIPYLALAIIVFFIIKFFMKVNFSELLSGKSEEGEVKYSIDEEIIRKKDIDMLINEAINKGDLRLALRYYYLKLLKQLEQKQYIKWEAQKTNFEYLKEIKNQDIKSGFNKFTNWYDYVWYGNYPIGQSDFDIMTNDFKSFFANLKTNNG